MSGHRRRLRSVLGSLRPGPVADEQLDCVVIGGGFLGLTALAQLRSEGYRAVLVTESGLGEGQSLHSHGWFHAGYLPGDADTAKTWKAGSAKTEAMLAGLGVDFLRAGRAYLAMGAGDDAEAKRAQSKEADVPLEDVPLGDLPGSAGGPLAKDSNQVFQTREWLFDKAKLTATLAAAHEDAIITYASPTSFERGADGAVETVVLSTGQRLATRSVAIAAGTGTRGVVETLGADAEWRGKFQSGTITMVCLNAPVGVIPDLAIMVTVPEAPLQVASRADDDDTVTWYITPKRPEDGAALEDFSGPGNEEAPVDGDAVLHAVEDFRTLFPVRPHMFLACKTAAGLLHKLLLHKRAGVFVGRLWPRPRRRRARAAGVSTTAASRASTARARATPRPCPAPPTSPSAGRALST